MHFNRPPAAGMHGFDIPLVDAALQKVWGEEVQPRQVEAGILTKPPWRPFRDPARIWLNADKLPYPRYQDDMLGSYIARQAATFFRQEHRRPFAARVSFLGPHSPFDFPVEDRDRFDSERFPVPPVGPQDAWQIPLIFRALSDADKRGIIAAYHTSVTFMDHNAGLVLDALRASGLAEDTQVLYWGDNGYSLGEHGRFEKHCFYKHAIRVPLIFRLPGRIPAGKIVGALTESADITPTLLELLGTAPLLVMHGASLVPYLEGGQAARRRDHIFSEYLHNEEVAIRTSRGKLIYCSGRRKRDDGYKTDNPTPGRCKLFSTWKPIRASLPTSQPSTRKPCANCWLSLCAVSATPTPKPAGNPPASGPKTRSTRTCRPGKLRKWHEISENRRRCDRRKSLR